MRTRRAVCLTGVVALILGCSDPTAPRIPQSEEEEEDDDDAGLTTSVSLPLDAVVDVTFASLSDA